MPWRWLRQGSERVGQKVRLGKEEKRFVSPLIIGNPSDMMSRHHKPKYPSEMSSGSVDCLFFIFIFIVNSFLASMQLQSTGSLVPTFCQFTISERGARLAMTISCQQRHLPPL